ncbi:hypothetical protein D3C87_1436000 [compost metagenome]
METLVSRSATFVSRLRAFSSKESAPPRNTFTVASTRQVGWLRSGSRPTLKVSCATSAATSGKNERTKCPSRDFLASVFCFIEFTMGFLVLTILSICSKLTYSAACICAWVRKGVAITPISETKNNCFIKVSLLTRFNSERNLICMAVAFTDFSQPHN